eukprot:364337-Chlamydomonas_euryale.AAC.3
MSVQPLVPTAAQALLYGSTCAAAASPAGASAAPSVARICQPSSIAPASAHTAHPPLLRDCSTPRCDSGSSPSAHSTSGDATRQRSTDTSRRSALLAAMAVNEAPAPPDRCSLPRLPPRLAPCAGSRSSASTASRQQPASPGASSCTLWRCLAAAVATRESAGQMPPASPSLSQAHSEPLPPPPPSSCNNRLLTSGA